MERKMRAGSKHNEPVNEKETKNSQVVQKLHLHLPGPLKQINMQCNCDSSKALSPNDTCLPGVSPDLIRLESPVSFPA